MFVNFNILNQLGSPAINSNTFANRPAAGQTGRLFVSTDTFEIYRDNGTGWDLIGGPGSSTVTGSGATGQVTYWTGTNTVSGENNLFWDAAQNHLGINTATPGVALDVHSAADVALQLNGTGATPSIFQQFLSAGVSQYQVGYNWNASADYRRFSIYDSVGAKETITIDQQSRYVGINYQYSTLADQPAYTLDVSGSGRFTDSAYFVTNGTGQTLIGSNTTANLGIVEIVAPTSATAISLRGRTSDNTSTINFNSNDGLTQYGYLSANASNVSIGASGLTRPIVFFTNGTDRGRFDENGVFSVNATAIISSSISAASFIPTGGTIPTNGMYLPSANTLAFATNTAQRITVSSTGSVGIGNNSPVSLLSLAGAFAKSLSNEDAWHLQIRDNTAMTTGVGGGIVLTGNYTSAGSGASFAAINSYKENATSSNGAAQLRFYTADAFSILNLCALFTSTGNFLVNKVIDAGQKLQVNGTTNGTKFNSLEDSFTNITSGSTTTIFTVAASEMYLCYITQGGTSKQVTFTVSVPEGGTTAEIGTISNTGATLTVSASGLNVQATNLEAFTVTVKTTYIRIK